MKILYVHGFGSQFDSSHKKVRHLETLGIVIGVDIDYCNGFDQANATIRDVVMANHVDLIVGTSMGGYMAARVGHDTGIPFVAINPATAPSQSLEKYVGTFIDHNGDSKHLTSHIANGYPDIQQSGCGLVLLDSGDEVINASDTHKLLDDVFKVHTFGGGCHRFSHIAESLPLIQDHINMARTTYGLDCT
jgi:predicted esterase YcpF (UPF0227 family)